MPDDEPAVGVGGGEARGRQEARAVDGGGVPAQDVGWLEGGLGGRHLGGVFGEVYWVYWVYWVDGGRLVTFILEGGRKGGL